MPAGRAGCGHRGCVGWKKAFRCEDEQPDSELVVGVTTGVTPRIDPDFLYIFRKAFEDLVNPELIKNTLDEGSRAVFIGVDRGAHEDDWCGGDIGAGRAGRPTLAGKRRRREHSNEQESYGLPKESGRDG